MKATKTGARGPTCTQRVPGTRRASTSAARRSRRWRATSSSSSRRSLQVDAGRCRPRTRRARCRCWPLVLATAARVAGPQARGAATHRTATAREGENHVGAGHGAHRGRDLALSDPRHDGLREDLCHAPHDARGLGRLPWTLEPPRPGAEPRICASGACGGGCEPATSCYARTHPIPLAQLEPQACRVQRSCPRQSDPSLPRNACERPIHVGQHARPRAPRARRTPKRRKLSWSSTGKCVTVPPRQSSILMMLKTRHMRPSSRSLASDGAPSGFWQHMRSLL